MPAAPKSAQTWQPLEIVVDETPLALQLSERSPRGEDEKRAVLLVVDDLGRSGEGVVPPSWVPSNNLVVLPLSALLQPQDSLDEPAAALGAVGEQIQERGLGRHVTLVAEGLATPVGALAATREDTPFAAYVGVDQLTSLSASRRWLQESDARPAWWWMRLRPRSAGSSFESITGFADALNAFDLRSLDRIAIPATVIAGKEDPLIPRHHLELWAGQLAGPRVRVVIARPARHVLRSSPSEVRSAIWSMQRDPGDLDCHRTDPASHCDVERTVWLGPSGAHEARSHRRYDPTLGTLFPHPVPPPPEDIATACDPDGPAPPWTPPEVHEHLRLQWNPESLEEPQQIPSAPGRLFRAMKRTSPPKDGEPGVIACSVRSRVGRLDVIDRADIAASLDIEGRTVTGNFAPGRASTHLAAASIKLEPGDTLEVRAKDRDTFRILDDHIGSLKLEYDGTWPIHGENAALEVTCRAMSRSAMVRSLGKQMRRLDRATRTLDAELDRQPSKWPLSTFWDAWLRLRPLMGSLGWADPCTRAWLARLAYTRVRWFDDKASRTAVDEAVPLGKWATRTAAASVRVTDAICSAPRKPEHFDPELHCRVDAMLRNTSERPMSVEMLLGTDLRPSMEMANGETLRLVPRDDARPPRPGAGWTPDASAVRKSPWRRDDQPGRASDPPFVYLSQRVVEPGAEIHIVWLGQPIRVRQWEWMVGFRPAAITFGADGGRKRLSLDSQPHDARRPASREPDG